MHKIGCSKPEHRDNPEGGDGEGGAGEGKGEEGSGWVTHVHP